MRFYFVSDTANLRYCMTLDEAHAFAKDCNRFDVSISEVEVPTDKENIARLLNNEGGYEMSRQYGRERSWVLTPRGGLREVKPGEEV